ncbi:MAG TPA: proline--tRNA ligase, partial [Peptococcaceae bacterium]|nr:proline--tRNA ligase [Peptococcaceae bacterium]
MRFSQMFSPTLRETPAEAEVISHKLLVRAGFIRKSSAGIYTYMPMGHRVLKKIEAIVRQEMDCSGGQEIMMPIIQPAELWLESGRWYVYGGELMRLKDRHDRDFCLGPTHEELITALVRDELNSWRQLPLRLYQIQNKYRDERRPRFGLMRGREFVMKDMYSFDRDEAGLEDSYQSMFDAYVRIFSRCGLDFRSVEADTGAIGGSHSHEFMVLAESGEAEIIYCSECSYAADGEIAAAQTPSAQQAEEGEMTLVATPGQETIQEVAAYLQIPETSLIKTLF